MKSYDHIIVIDAIAFAGGSKVATNDLLMTFIEPTQKITVITRDRNSWDQRFQFMRLFEPSWLTAQEQGMCYFLRHLLLTLHLIVARLRYGKINLAIGASSPGVDLSIYLSQKILGFRILQLIHGPVPSSGTVARCLMRATYTFYLQSSLDSIKQCLKKSNNQQQTDKLLNSGKFHLLNIGLGESSWPSQCQYHTPQILWAASLLKWKGLDFFIDAMSSIPLAHRPAADICYIRPYNTRQPISLAPVLLPKLYWHQQPKDLDRIRANCNIFISTSNNEPFGLSILEALAAGHCVIIPQDNAYWDQTLHHGVNCIKYRANNLNDLTKQVLILGQNLKKIKQICQNGQQVSRHYHAKDIYKTVRDIVLM